MILSRRTIARTASVAVPLAIELLGFKAVRVFHNVPVEGPPWALSIAAIALCGCAALAVRWRLAAAPGGARRRWPVLLMVVMGTLAAAAVYGSLPLLILLRVWELVRADLLVVCVFALVCALLIDLSRGWARTGAVGLLYVTGIALMLLTSVQLGFFLSSGSIGDWYLLSYAATHIQDVVGTVTAEMNWVKALLLCIPAALIAAALVLYRLPPVARWADATDRGTRLAWVMALAPLALAASPHSHLPPRYAVHRASLLTERIPWFDATPALDPEQANAVDQAVPIFDTAGLRFSATPHQRALNLVVILLESTSTRATSVYNPDLPTTPFLADLARKSLVVDDMYALVPHTSKAMVAVLCGIPPKIALEIEAARHGGIPGRCVPALLKEHGYASAFFTSGSLTFENNTEMMRNMAFDTMRAEDSYDHEGFTRLDYAGFEDRMMLRPSLEWVDEVRARGTPFFLTYRTVAGHHPYMVPESHAQQTYGTAVNDRQQHYFNALRYRDDFLSDVFRGFEQRGLMDSTVFILLGDHGEAFGEHGRSGHDDVPWEEVLHIPALIYGPAIFPQARRIDGLRQQIDVLPTIAGVLGLALDGGRIPGYDLLGPVPADRRLYFSSWYGDHWLAYRQGAEKRIYHYRWLLPERYDLERDPLERTNLAAADTPQALGAAELDLLRWARAVNRMYR